MKPIYISDEPIYTRYLCCKIYIGEGSNKQLHTIYLKLTYSNEDFKFILDALIEKAYHVLGINEAMFAKIYITPKGELQKANTTHYKFEGIYDYHKILDMVFNQESMLMAHKFSWQREHIKSAKDPKEAFF